MMREQNGLSHRLSSEPITIPVTRQELKTGSLSWPHLELAIRALHRDGLIVLEDVIEHGELDVLNKKMVEDARILQSAGEDSPYNYNKGSVLSAI